MVTHGIRCYIDSEIHLYHCFSSSYILVKLYGKDGCYIVVRYILISSFEGKILVPIVLQCLYITQSSYMEGCDLLLYLCIPQ